MPNIKQISEIPASPSLNTMPNVTTRVSVISEPYIARGQGGGELPLPGKLSVSFPNIVFDFAVLILIAILVRNLYTGDPVKVCGVYPRRQKSRRYGPEFGCLRSLLISTVFMFCKHVLREIEGYRRRFCF